MYLLYMTNAYIEYKAKIDGQIHAFAQYGFKALILYLDYHQKCIKRIDVNSDEHTETVLYQHHENENLIKEYFWQAEKIIRNMKIDVLYFRRMGSALLFENGFFKRISKYTKVVYEIPTYPVDKPLDFKGFVSINLEMMYFYLFVYRRLTCIPACIQKEPLVKLNKICPISNAVELCDYEIPIPDDNETIIFVSIAHLKKWHGIEKMISAIEQYKGKKEIKLIIYSSQSEYVDELKKMVGERQIKSIVFRSNKGKNEIVRELSGNLIGVGGLLYGTRGATFDTSLKNKDYCSMGIPFVHVLRDQAFDTDFKYAYQLKESIDLDKIVEWYQALNKKEMRKEMVDYALHNLTYKSQIENYIDTLDVIDGN